MSTFRSEEFFDNVASGCVWSGDSYGVNRNASMTTGAVYLSGVRLAVSAVTSRLFTASVDTYIDVNSSGVVIYGEVANNSASVALAAGNIRIGILVTGATTIANVGSVNQGQETKVLPIASSIAYSVTDSLGNLICSRDANHSLLGYRQITTAFTTSTTPGFVDVTGLSVPVIVPANRKIIITIWSGSVKTSAIAGTALSFAIREAATGLTNTVVNEPVSAYNMSLKSEVVTSPSTGLHTYLMSVAQSAAGTITVDAGTVSGATNPGAPFIMVRLA